MPSERIKIKMRKRNRRDDRAKAVRIYLTKCSFVRAFLIMYAYETLHLKYILPCC